MSRVLPADDERLLLSGVCRADVAGGVVRPYRDRDLLHGGDAPGVRVLVRTDSETVGFRVEHLPRASGEQRHRAWVVRAEGREVVVQGPALGPVVVPAPPGDGRLREVELLSPYAESVALHGVVVEASAAVAPVEQSSEPLWLALGDSITQGFSASGPHTGWVERVRAALQWRAVNAGIGGHVARAQDARLADGLDADVVTVAFGINDCLQERGTARFRAELTGLVEGVRTACPRAVLLLMTPTPHAPGSWPQLLGLEDYREQVREAAARTGSELVEGDELLDPTRLELLTAEDRLHPDDAGFAAMAEAVAPRLRKLVDG